MATRESLAGVSTGLALNSQPDREPWVPAPVTLAPVSLLLRALQTPCDRVQVICELSCYFMATGAFYDSYELFYFCQRTSPNGVSF